MKRLACIGAAAWVVGGCGSGLEGTLAWERDPVVRAHSLTGSVRNTTSHSVTLDPKAMRLLDGEGRKVPGRIFTSEERLGKGATSSFRATWKSGTPVRIDYGSGALALPSD